MDTYGTILCTGFLTSAEKTYAKKLKLLCTEIILMILIMNVEIWSYVFLNIII